MKSDFSFDPEADDPEKPRNERLPQLARARFRQLKAQQARMAAAGGTPTPPDTTAPTLSAASAGTPTTDGATGAGVTTNESGGTLYWAVVTDGGSCTDAQLKAGSGGNIVSGKAGSQSVVASGAQSLSAITGLSAGTTYQIKYLHRDASGNDSSQASVSLATVSTGHRYWRLKNFTGTRGSYLETSEIQLLASGVNVVSGKTPTCSTAPSGSAASYLTDGVLNLNQSYWLTAVADTLVLTWDLGAGNAQNVDSAKIAMFDNAARQATAVTLEYSDDNVSWTTVGTGFITPASTAYTLSPAITFTGSQYSVLSPWDKGNNTTLSGGNLVITCGAPAGWRLARGVLGKSTGKKYFEATVSTLVARQIIGLAANTVLTSSYVGDGLTSWGLYSNSGNSAKIYNAGTAALGSAWASGMVIQVAADLDNGKIWFGQNNTWLGSGDPAAGTNPAYTGLSGVLYPAWSGYDAGEIDTFNFGGSSWAYTPPTGFSGWSA